MPEPTPAEVAAVLRRAAERITPETWCQGAWARDADGVAVPHDYPGACRWCIGGAIKQVATGWIECLEMRKAAHRAIQAVVGTHSADFNDAPGRTAAEVRDALLAAAERVEAEAKP